MEKRPNLAKSNTNICRTESNTFIIKQEKNCCIAGNGLLARDLSPLKNTKIIQWLNLPRSHNQFSKSVMWVCLGVLMWRLLLHIFPSKKAKCEEHYLKSHSCKSKSFEVPNCSLHCSQDIPFFLCSNSIFQVTMEWSNTSNKREEGWILRDKSTTNNTNNEHICQIYSHNKT